MMNIANGPYSIQPVLCGIVDKGGKTSYIKMYRLFRAMTGSMQKRPAEVDGISPNKASPHMSVNGCHGNRLHRGLEPKPKIVLFIFEKWKYMYNSCSVISFF